MNPKADARAHAAHLVAQLAGQLAAQGVDLPLALKARDTREPGRREKTAMENALFAVVRRYWKQQRSIIQSVLETRAPLVQKSVFTDWFGDDWAGLFAPAQEGVVAALIKLFTGGAQGGISLFKADVPLKLDYTLTNAQAARWASKYAYSLVKDIDDKTRAALREAVTQFVETPGFALRDVVAALPFDAERGLLVATTETTRAYAQGQTLAAQALKQEWPGVDVVETWYTNNDSKVCPVCGPLNGKEVPAGEGFSTASGEGLDGPPAHPGCRCWKRTRTRVAR